MTDLAIRATGATVASPEKLSTDQLKYIANTELIPKAYRGNMPAIMACVLTGRALGIDDLTALRWIHVVDGKATLGAECMVALVRSRGHSISGSLTDTSATVNARRFDNGDEFTYTFTIDMAKRAGLTGKGNWQKYPEAMLWARSVSQVCRILFSDVFLGLAYTGEEMGEEGVTVQVVEDVAAAPVPQVEDESVDGEVVDDTSLFGDEDEPF